MLKRKDSGLLIIATLIMLLGAAVLIRTLGMDESITLNRSLYKDVHLDGMAAYVTGVLMVGIGLLIAIRA